MKSGLGQNILICINPIFDLQVQDIIIISTNNKIYFRFKFFNSPIHYHFAFIDSNIYNYLFSIDALLFVLKTMNYFNTSFKYRP